MKIFQKFKSNPMLLVLFSTMVVVLLFTTACGSLPALFTLTNAIIAGVGIVIAAVGTLLSPTEAKELTDIVNEVGQDVILVEDDVNAFEGDKDATGIVAKVQSSVATLQASLSKLLIAAHIKNVTVQNYITKVVNLVGTVIEDVVTEVLPRIPSAMSKFAMGQDKEAKALNANVKSMAIDLRAQHDIILEESGLSADVIEQVRKHISKKTERHLGPLHI